MISLHKADQNLNSMQHKKINSTLLRIFRPKTMLNRHGVWVAGVRTASFVMTREVKLENGFGLMESVARQFLVPLLLPALVATVPQACDIPWHPVTSRYILSGVGLKLGASGFCQHGTLRGSPIRRCCSVVRAIRATFQVPKQGQQRPHSPKGLVVLSPEVGFAAGLTGLTLAWTGFPYLQLDAK